MLTGFMHTVSFLGSAAFYLPVLAVAFWCVNPRPAARYAVLLAAGGALNTLLKLVFQDPRPYWTDPGIIGHESQSSFGMPSGHAQSAAVAYGYPAARPPRGRSWATGALWAAAAAVIVLVGVSRVYLGVHSVGQVLAGYAVGAALIAVALLLERVVVAWWTGRGLAAQLGLSVLVGLSSLGGTALAVESGYGVLPAAWRRAIVAAGGTAAPVTLERGAMVTGLLCGVLAGLSLLARRGWFEAAAPLPRRLARVGVGAAGILALFAASRLLPDVWPVDFAVQAAAGAWLTAGAPETFVRLGLASRDVPATGPATGPAAGPAEHGPAEDGPAEDGPVRASGASEASGQVPAKPRGDHPAG